MIEQKNILVSIPVTESHKEYLESMASASGVNCNFLYVEHDRVTADDLKDVNVVIGNIDPGLLREAQDLEWLQLNSAGADRYIRSGILPENAVLTNATGAYGLSVSEHMIAMTFDLIRHFPSYYRNKSEHVWKDAGNVISVEGSRILIMGVGDIGGSYAKKMKALGAYTIGVRRTSADKPDFLDEQYTIEDLDKILPEADIAAMVLPGGDATYHIMDKRRLYLMKKGAYLINVGRGSSIDPDGLHAVMSEGYLGGCALDVTEPEPLPADDPLWDMDNVLITPHVAGSYFLAETLERIVKIAGENLELYLKGEPLKNQVDFETGYVTL